MARSDSTIRVNIIGDASKLTTTLGKTETRMGTFGKVAVGLLALGAVKEGIDVIGGFLENADRAGDAASRLTSTLGETDTAKLQDIADGFSDIGVSAPDFLEIAAGFSEFAAASGKMTPDQITDMAAGVVSFAGALAAVKNVDPASLGDDIATFISGTKGAAGAAKELGVPFDAALTPAQRYAQLMEKLPGLLDSVTGANQGLDDKQNELNAKWETFGSKVGPPVEGLLKNILDFILDEIDAIPGAIQGWELLGAKLGEAATPLARIVDLLGNTLGLLQEINKINIGDVADFLGQGGTGQRRDFGGTTEADINRAVRNSRERNGLGDSIGGF